MKKALLSIIFIYGMSLSLFAEESKVLTLNKISSANDLNIFLKYYYTNPNLELVPKAMKYIRDQKLNENKDLERHFVPFFAEIFRTNDEQIPIWFKNLTPLSNDDIYNFAHSMYLAGGKNGKIEIQNFLKSTNNEELKQVLTKLSSNTNPIDLKTVPLTDAVFLDMLWSSFFATGDVDFLDKLILATETNKNSINEVLIFSAARWSVKANAKEHKKIYDYCVSKNGKYSDDINAFLLEISGE
ncbi:hypothetical protein JWG40_15075 [Leptospira sp. 201903074]|uniref:hypothetical protein n=1 Tax=Leptospira abararensis TaxID=2810036 RepID=UPI0019640256|nr:hypothetical protein [Leptospira abararensis]MBM9548347.1 hypothetical protein [Leptospira abararensis]